MLDQSPLLEANEQLGLLNDIYQDTSNLFRESSLSNYIQIAVADVYRASQDKSLWSLDIQRHCSTDELRHELSTNRFNFLASLNLEGIGRALDLSEDMGGVAHYLADHVHAVDALKTDPNRALLSLLRCAGKPNVCHLSEDLDKLIFPAGQYDLIVVGALEAFALDKDAQQKLVSRLQAALTPRGVMVVSARNKNRIGKWLTPFNQTRDESGSGRNALAYQELYAGFEDQEYSYSQLITMLASANLAAVDFHATFSKDEGCDNLFSEDYLGGNLNALNHFYRLGAIENAQLNEYLVFRNLIQQRHRALDLASRYVVVAGSSTAHTRRVYNNDFSYYAGSGRKPHWRTFTERSRAAANVSKKPVYPELSAPVMVSDYTVRQNLDPQPFEQGRILVDDWLSAVLADDANRFEQLVMEYADWLATLETRDDFCATAYDLLPFNVIVKEKGGNRTFSAIDAEWQIDGAFDADFIMFRALFWFAFQNKQVLRGFAEHTDLTTLALFVAHWMPNASLIGELDRFVQIEEEIQSQIDSRFRAKSVAYALLQPFSGDSLSMQEGDLICQLSWSDSAGSVDEEHAAYADWNESAEPQSVALSVPAYQAGLNVLRIDPLASKGIFAFSSLSLSDDSGQLIYQLSSQADILAHAETVNLRELDDGSALLALNDDPHLLLDVSGIDNIEAVSSAQLSLHLLHDAHYDAALNSLSAALAEQNNTLTRQANKLNQYRSELEYVELRLADVIGHRTDLNDMLNQSERDKRQQVGELKSRLHHLNEQLVAQLGRNEEMESFLMMRPSTRIKRFVSRNLARLTGKAPPPEEPELIEEPEVEVEVDPNAVPESGELLGQNTEDYQLWISENDLSTEQIDAAKEEIEAMPVKPVFSILVPIYNTDPEYLIPMIRSVQAQIYPHWQLCLVDDCSPKKYLRSILEYEAAQDSRIHIQLNDHNQGIALTTNDALAMAKGDYIALLDHDDEISNDALYQNAKAINAHPDVGLLYSDEDKMDMQGNRLEPYFKPDYSPDLLDTNNYVCHFTVMKKTIAEEIGGFLEGLDGSQDHDIILRAAMTAERVMHIPRILYHWRKIPGSTAVAYDSKSYAWEAGRKAIENCLSKREDGISVEFGVLKGTYRVVREIRDEPLVSIVIPFKDKPDLLHACLNSILAKTTYQNIEVVGVSNNSEQPETHAAMTEFSARDERIRFVEKNVPFNFSAICNYGVEQATGDYIVLLNNDIEIVTPDWIERLLEHAQRDEIGAVGGKLLFPDGRIQHAGVVAGMVGAAGHPHKFFPGDHIGYHGRLQMVNNVSAVTGAMMMVKRSKYLDVGGLDAENLAVAYNDIDLCLKLIDNGYLNVFTPHCQAIHHESISRGYEDTPEKVQRLTTERDHFLATWKDYLDQGDPWYNPNLSLKNERFSLNFRD